VSLASSHDFPRHRRRRPLLPKPTIIIRTPTGGITDTQPLGPEQIETWYPACPAVIRARVSHTIRITKSSVCPRIAPILDFSRASFSIFSVSRPCFSSLAL
jgi:hypothetical protein